MLQPGSFEWFCQVLCQLTSPNNLERQGAEVHYNEAKGRSLPEVGVDGWMDG